MMIGLELSYISVMTQVESDFVEPISVQAFFCKIAVPCS